MPLSRRYFSKASSIEAVKLLPWCISAAVPFCYISRAVTNDSHQHNGGPTIPEPYTIASEPEPDDSLAPGPLDGLTPPPGTSPLPVSSLPGIPLACTLLLGHPFSDFLATQSQSKQDHSPCSSLDHLHTKRTHVCSPEVEVRFESSSSWGDQDTLELVPETGPRPSSEQRGQEPVNPPSPSSATIGLIDGTAAGSLKSTKDPASFSSESSWGNVDYSDMDRASEDCLSCSDTDDVSVQTAHKKYMKRVWASCKLRKSNLWMETQQKRINYSCHDVWEIDHKIIRTEQKHGLAEDCTFFEMQRMTTMTNQLLHIAEAPGSKIYTRESEVETQGQTKALVLSLKQYHTHYFRFYEKGTTRAIEWNGWSPRITYEWCFLVPDCFHQGRTEVILSMVLQAGQNHRDHSHPLKRGPLLPGYCVQLMPIVC